MNDTKYYYDNVSQIYDKHRRGKHSLYFKLLYKYALNLLISAVKNKNVLELGCGTGMIMELIKDKTSFLIGVDNSPLMLAQARKRGLNVIDADLNEKLPFADDTFDVTYSFKVLAHIKNITSLIEEAARVTRNEGLLVLEFYNPWSLRRIIQLFNPPHIYTRFDSFWRAKQYLPPGCEIIRVAGTRIVTLTGYLYKIPIIRNAIYFFEELFSKTLLVYFAGYLVLVVKLKK